MAYDPQKSSVPLSGNVYAKQRKTLSFSDFDLSFRKNTVTNALIEVRDEHAIKQSLKNLLQLNKYEKPFHPEINGGIRELLFEPFETDLEHYQRQFKTRIEKLVKQYEPRVELNDVVIAVIPEQNALGIDITYTMVGSPREITNTFVLERLR